jgi:hypothetical protein
VVRPIYAACTEAAPCTLAETLAKVQQPEETSSTSCSSNDVRCRQLVGDRVLMAGCAATEDITPHIGTGQNQQQQCSSMVVLRLSVGCVWFGDSYMPPEDACILRQHSMHSK